jgi:hypothetical protein
MKTPSFEDGQLPLTALGINKKTGVKSRTTVVWKLTLLAPGSVLSRADIYGFGRSLRPPQGTTSTPRRRALFR